MAGDFDYRECYTIPEIDKGTISQYEYGKRRYEEEEEEERKYSRKVTNIPLGGYHNDHDQIYNYNPIVNFLKVMSFTFFSILVFYHI